MRTILEFGSEQEARDYRHEHGTGGWISSEDRTDTNRLTATAPAVLFPPDMTPTAILRHPITRGRTGMLYGN